MGKSKKGSGRNSGKRTARVPSARTRLKLGQGSAVLHAKIGNGESSAEKLYAVPEQLQIWKSMRPGQVARNIGYRDESQKLSPVRKSKVRNEDEDEDAVNEDAVNEDAVNSDESSTETVVVEESSADVELNAEAEVIADVELIAESEQE